MTKTSVAIPVMAWPFQDEAFPRDLAAVVMDSVLEGKMPALQVVHFPGGEWGIADGVHQPNEHNCTATHIWHVLDRDGSLRGLAAIPPGYQADRMQPGEEWTISRYEPGRTYGLTDRLRFSMDIIRFGEEEAERRRTDRMRTQDIDQG